MSDQIKPDVFLGGACGSTTWRTTIAIPALETAEVTYYNPQVDEWHAGLVEIEREAKQNAAVLLFVISDETRGIASMVEATEALCGHQYGPVNLVLVVQDIPSGVEIDGDLIIGHEWKDINRGRQYLRSIAAHHGVVVHQSVDEAVAAIIRGRGQ